ncbi:MAG: hypothetical protein EOP56_00270 [Sphingobacteriales bacterium]|nr:MAG: hypothetical protein EOP56_00270 [Sphingobacteriales bacterium]
MLLEKILVKSFAAFGATSLLLIPYFAAMFALGESYDPFRPDIDTKFAPGFSQLKFDSIHPGMDSTVVLNILGKPIYTYGDSVTTQWSYSSDAKCKCYDLAWLTKVIILQDGKVIDKLDGVAFD